MEESAQNLHVIKTEQQIVLSSSEYQSNNIKERLNLHVKRRLQQEASIMHFASDNQNNDEPFLTSPIALKTNLKSQQKEAPKTRRPYQRRDKSTKNSVVANVSFPNKVPADIIAIQTPENLTRKRRQKTKYPIEPKRSLNTTTPSAVNITDAVFTKTPKKIRSDDDASHDGLHDYEWRTTTARDKDKWPDILGMVISMKRREVLQDPTVQSFFRQIMGAIKS